MFLTAYNGEVRDCVFHNNKGGKGVFKIYQVFNESLQSASKIIRKKTDDGIITISNRAITVNPKEDHGIFIEGRETGRIEITGCEFNGKLKKGAMYIAGLIGYRNSDIIEVKNFEFEFDKKSSVKIELMNDE